MVEHSQQFKKCAGSIKKKKIASTPSYDSDLSVDFQKRKKNTLWKKHILNCIRSVIIIQPINYLLYKHKLQQLKEQKTLS